MKKQKVFVRNIINQPREHDYNIKNKKRKTILYYSDNSEWTRPGDKVAVLEDDGDGYKIGLKDMDNSIILNYAQAQELLILLSYKKDSDFKIK